MVKLKCSYVVSETATNFLDFAALSLYQLEPMATFTSLGRALLESHPVDEGGIFLTLEGERGREGGERGREREETNHVTDNIY